MTDALKASGVKTKKEAVELGLRTLIKLNQQRQLRSMKGRLEWRGDLDTMRSDV
ncbi:type II toxin-antitoxin system VapB family antitoxin [Acetobacter lambici]|nr:type II toxin-antitoxin system VapB family antitoxin [Acetobacter lambici]MCP1244277.1 type II toxin-antitoxin system VapB family antitoxin [Acetobacter lambici]